MKATAAFFSFSFVALINVARLQNIREEAEQFLKDVESNFHQRGADERELYRYATSYEDGKVMNEAFVAEIISICTSLELGGHHPCRLGCHRVNGGGMLGDLLLVYEYLEAKGGFALTTKGEGGTHSAAHAQRWNDFYLSGKGEKITQVLDSTMEKICLNVYQHPQIRGNDEADSKRQLRVIGCQAQGIKS